MREALIAHYVYAGVAQRIERVIVRTGLYANSNELGLLIPWSQVRVLPPAPEEELLKPF